MWRRKPRSAARAGCLVSAAVIGLGILVGAAIGASSYSGRCTSLMDGPAVDCSFFGAVIGAVFYFFLISFVLYWWAIVPALLLPPLIGAAIDLLRLRQSR
jgi:hypothetical protein